MIKCLKCGEDRPATEFIKGAKLICNPCRGIRTLAKGGFVKPKPKRVISALIIEYDDGKQQRYNKEENNENKK